MNTSILSHSFGRAVLILLTSNSLSAAILLGNYPPANDDITDTLTPAPFTINQIAADLTLPSGSDYTIDSVTLRFGNYRTDAGDVASVGFYTDNGNQPGTLVASLLSAPSSTSDTIGNFLFTPSGTITLSASTKYWLLVQGSAGSFDWHGANPGQTPTGAATWSLYKFSFDNGGSYFEISDRPSFEINATAVPEPEHYGLAIGTALVVFSVVRRKMRNPQ